MPEKSSFILRILLPILILVLAAGTAVWLVFTSPEPKQQAPGAKGVLVKVQRVERWPHKLFVNAQGTVEAFRTATLQPQVEGRIVWLNDKLTAGGLIDDKTVLLRLEQRDYELALRNARTALAQAESELALEKGRVRTAEREWEMFGDRSVDAAPNDLALRRPQLEAAKAAVKAAEIRVDEARLALERTEVKAPFAAVVLEENVAMGSLLSPQSTVATLAATEHFRIRVAVPVSKLSAMSIPGFNAEKGSMAYVRHDLGFSRIEKKGRVSRLRAEIDPAGRMAHLFVEVEDPMNRSGAGTADGKEQLPLLIGAYVEVEIAIPAEHSLIKVPREAMHNGDEVYVFTGDGRLAIRRVDIAWNRRHSVLVDKGLEEGERIIVSRLISPVEGMQLRLHEKSDDQMGEAP